MSGGSLFVTGCYRSGTTLLDKLLSTLPGVFVGHQPFTQLYLAAKSQFLELSGLASKIPLGPMFPAPAYAADEFGRFLAGFNAAEFSAARRETILKSLPEPLRAVPIEGPFEALRMRLVLALAKAHGREELRWVGEKEIVCEEFIPYLLERDVLVVLVVRDPRDVVRSAHLGRARDYVGRKRPVLFTLRTWRKSVAFALRHQGRGNFVVVRFEDLLNDPGHGFARLGERLAANHDRLPDLARLPNQQGDPWSPNSSHPDGPRPDLPPGLDRFIETVCGPEMRALGYPATAEAGYRATIGSFREPWPVTHRLFRNQRVDLGAELALEADRLADLERAEPTRPELFVLGRETHADLRRAPAS